MCAGQNWSGIVRAAFPKIIRELTCFCFRMECRIGSRYAAVFPDPVFALARISRPSNAKGIALLCTGVGVLKFSLVIPWRSRVSSPRLAKVFSSFCASNSSAGTGTSLASNFRFMLAVCEVVLTWLKLLKTSKIFLLLRLFQRPLVWSRDVPR